MAGPHHAAPRPPLRVVERREPSREEEDLVTAIRAGEAWARRALFERHAPMVERMLWRVLGHDRHDEMADLVHDCFCEALAGIDRLRDPAALVGWLQSIAVHRGLRTIRARRARRWLLFWEPQALPDPPFEAPDPELREAWVRTQAVLDGLPAEERVVFVLRHVEGMELAEAAAICEVSLATFKRRLVRAEGHFAARARREPLLRRWLEEGGRWSP